MGYLIAIVAVLAVGFWFVCGIVAVWIVNRKGNNSCAAFLIGFALGPIGIALAITAPNLIAKQNELRQDQIRAERNAIKRGQSKICPHCGKLIRTDAFICNYCGNNVRATTPYPTGGSPIEPVLDPNETSELWECSNCQRTNSTANSFCERCGARRTYNS